MPPRMIRSENEWSLFSNQNVSMKWINIGPFATRLASFESYQSQLFIGATLVSNGPILTRLIVIFWFVYHSFSRPLILGGDRTHAIAWGRVCSQRVRRCWRTTRCRSSMRPFDQYEAVWTRNFTKMHDFENRANQRVCHALYPKPHILKENTYKIWNKVHI